ncbi:uncharacterized protein LOC108739278 [Agrilus planipennis]|uniref:Uncharacterized protein LOC108739278 n=1 Tax=Agrilus planipennis TaxID=224129 RepID=A0A1W4X706_AGRPL|nr:uncharacterized protein LOC108739278 [Agrilus planipennis]
MASSVDDTNKENEEIVRQHVENLLDDLSLKVESLELTREVVNNFNGFITNAVVVAKDSNGTKKSFNWIVKTAPTFENFRILSMMEDCYEREIEAYKLIFPAFNEFQKELGISNRFQSYPKCYYDCSEHLNETLILENMKERGYELPKCNNPLNVEHALIVIREYGKLHALSFALKDQKPEKFLELKNQSKGNYFSSFGDDQLDHFLGVKRKSIMGCLNPDEDKALIKKFEKFIEKSKKMIRDIYNDEYAVYTHGDCWTNNLLFKYENPKKPNSPTDVCLIDFQMSSFSSPIADVSYFILGNTDCDFRKKHCVYLLKEYYASLSRSIKSLGSNPDKLYSVNVFRKQLDEYMAYGLFFSAIGLKLLLTDKEDFPDLYQVVTIDNLTDAFSCNHSDKFKKRMRDILLDCSKAGYL